MLIFYKNTQRANTSIRTKKYLTNIITQFFTKTAKILRHQL